MKQEALFVTIHHAYPAAFRRLCVETLSAFVCTSLESPAAFRRLCVETFFITLIFYQISQPPSGGCVLKPVERMLGTAIGLGPAAFRRLCVETAILTVLSLYLCPAAFRRLCVETTNRSNSNIKILPAAFRRLCVETVTDPNTGLLEEPAAFRRLCVETLYRETYLMTLPQPPSGGCVLKLSQIQRFCRRFASRLQAAVC